MPVCDVLTMLSLVVPPTTLWMMIALVPPEMVLFLTVGEVALPKDIPIGFFESRFQEMSFGAEVPLIETAIAEEELTVLLVTMRSTEAPITIP